MIERSFNADKINEIINHPDIFRLVAKDFSKPLDLTADIQDQNNFLLVDGDNGGIFFKQHEPTVYEAHTQFLPTVRGASALKSTRQAIHYMFTRTDCMELVTRVPVFNVKATFWARAAGASLDFECKNAWKNDDGAFDVKYYALRYYDWVRDNPRLMASGHWFHERLEEAKKRMGATIELHDDDASHDAHVGAAIEMIFGGQVAKGIVLYNRWARLAGYATVDLISINPLIIDQKDAWVLVHDTDFEVLKCL